MHTIMIIIGITSATIHTHAHYYMIIISIASAVIHTHAHYYMIIISITSATIHTHTHTVLSSVVLILSFTHTHTHRFAGAADTSAASEALPGVTDWFDQVRRPRPDSARNRSRALYARQRLCQRLR